MVVNCPQCGKKVVWDSKNPFRPFCSERCKQTDLGAWAQEKYVIPGAASESEEEPNKEE